MAAKLTWGNLRSEKSKTSLPCIGEGELLKPPASFRDTKPKSSSKSRARVSSEPLVSKVEHAKKTSEVDEGGKDKKLSKWRRGSIPVGWAKLKDSSDSKEAAKDAAKTRRGSKKKIQPVNPPSPDVIDLSNEKVVQELLLRLYETLKVPDNIAHEGSLVEQNNWQMEECGKNEPTNLSNKLDNRMRTRRQRITKFPQLRKSTSNFEVFYSEPLSCKSLKNRQLQRRRTTTDILAFQGSSPKSSQQERKDTFNRQLVMTWSYGDRAQTSMSRAVLRDGGLSVPCLMRPGNAFVSPKLFKASFEPRKSITFAV